MSVILAIETSCDETSVALIRNGSEVLANVISSQIDVHAAFGGVVPEVASRMHLEMIKPLLDEAFSEAGLKKQDVSAVAATRGPGLVGALLVGVSVAKSLALVWGVPYVGVNHVEGHLFATFLERPDLQPPLIVLLVAGGHTQIVHVRALGDYDVLGKTIDDAAGEAFDKVARYLGLGYPGGPLIDALSHEGDVGMVRFPRGMKDGSFDFSFSGLKTAVVNYVRKNPTVKNADVSACFQEAVVDVLVSKTIAAAKHVGSSVVCIGGGVAANSALRERIAVACEREGFDCLVPRREFCTDNAAMIGAVASWQLQEKGSSSLAGGVDPSLGLGC